LTEQAKLAKYPNLVLSADMGFSTVSDLIFGAGGSFFGPIYTGGAIESQIASATAIQRESLMTYGLSILNAFNEVETAMSSEKYLLEQQRHITNSIEESKNAYQLMLKQYAVGRVGLFEVLQTQMEWLLRELDLVNINGEIYAQRVQLYLALGGNINKY
jgi:outer membrane protein TolC